MDRDIIHVEDGEKENGRKTGIKRDAGWLTPPEYFSEYVSIEARRVTLHEIF